MMLRFLKNKTIFAGSLMLLALFSGCASTSANNVPVVNTKDKSKRVDTRTISNLTYAHEQKLKSYIEMRIARLEKLKKISAPASAPESQLKFEILQVPEQEEVKPIKVIKKPKRVLTNSEKQRLRIIKRVLR